MHHSTAVINLQLCKIRIKNAVGAIIYQFNIISMLGAIIFMHCNIAVTVT